MQKVIIGSRGSDLALWQANDIKSRLEALGAEVVIKIIKTRGDVIQHLSFDKLEGKGFFIKELEEALLNHEIDVAVHSHKDLETTIPLGLEITAVTERESPLDLLIIHKENVDLKNEYKIKKNAIIGTSSARRKSQILRLLPTTKLHDLRGNVPTRIQKLRDKKYDGIVLAHAGVERLNLDLSEFETTLLSPAQFVPAPAQGALAIQMRSVDSPIHRLVRKLNHKHTLQTVNIERAVLKAMNGGCQLPLGVYCPNVEEAFVSFAECADKAAMVKHIFSKNNLVEKIIKEIGK